MANLEARLHAPVKQMRRMVVNSPILFKSGTPQNSGNFLI